VTACPHCREIQEERAAIHQYDGGATRERAEALAATERCQEHRSRICRFLCDECGVEVVFNAATTNPLSLTGGCKDCGSKRWRIIGPDGEPLA